MAPNDEQRYGTETYAGEPDAATLRHRLGELLGSLG